MGGEKRRQKSLRIGVHHANAVVWGPVYRTHLDASRCKKCRRRSSDVNRCCTLSMLCARMSRCVCSGIAESAARGSASISSTVSGRAGASGSAEAAAAAAEAFGSGAHPVPVPVPVPDDDARTVANDGRSPRVASGSSRGGAAARYWRYRASAPHLYIGREETDARRETRSFLSVRAEETAPRGRDGDGDGDGTGTGTGWDGENGRRTPGARRRRRRRRARRARPSRGRWRARPRALPSLPPRLSSSRLARRAVLPPTVNVVFHPPLGFNI